MLSLNAGASKNPLANPAHNVPYGNAFLYACNFTTNSLAIQQRCDAAALPRFDAARKLEGLPPLKLPKQFPAMSFTQQILVLFNLERTARNLPPAYGVSPQMSRLALVGAKQLRDPDGGATSDLSLGSRSTLEAFFGWLYADGWGGTRATTWNGDCTSAKNLACWGHRESILTGVGSVLLIGTADIAVKGYGSVTLNINGFAPSAGATSNTLLAEYDTATGALIGTTTDHYSLASGSGDATPMGANVANDSQDLWLLNADGPTTGDSSVLEVSLSTRAVVRTIVDPSMQQSTAISSDGTDVWVTSPANGPFDSGSVTEINAATGDVERVITATSMNDTSINGPFAISSDGLHVWILNVGGYVTELDATTGTIIQSEQNPLVESASDVSFAGPVLWLTQDPSGTASGSIAEIALATNSTIQAFSEPSLQQSSGISETGSTAWITNYVGVNGWCEEFTCGSTIGTVDQVDTTTGAVTHVLRNSYFSSAGSVATDGTKIWIACTGYGNSTNTPATIEVDSSTSKVVRVIHSPNISELPSQITVGAGVIWVAYSSISLPAITGPSWYALAATDAMN
jgi:hypothetical protein